jgi:protoporphyrinogen oxidase
LVRHARSGSEIERDGVCYTMRTYVMAREDKDSDATRMVRATRCLPAWKLEYKTAVAPVRPSRDDNPAMR